MSLPTPPSSTPVSLRSSCSFCRRRKIKCSGESTGCKACSTRGQPCIFEATAPMGRPRKIRPGDESPPVVVSRPSSVKSVATGAGGSSQRRASVASASSSTQAETKRRPPLRSESAETKGYASRKAPRVTLENVLVESLSKLRITPFKTTYDAFSKDTLGTMVQAFYGLVSHSPPPPSSLPTPPSAHSPLFRGPSFPSSSTSASASHRVPEATRHLYETVFATRQASCSPRQSTLRHAKIAQGGELWGWIGSEIMSVVGGFEGMGKAKEGPDACYLLRLLEEDQSVPFETNPSVNLNADPIRRVTCPEVSHLLSRFFEHSPFSYLINDSLLIASLQTHTFDPALLCALLGIALTLPLSSSPPPPLHAAPGRILPTSAEFISYSRALLLTRLNEHAATSLSTIQALLVLSVHVGSNHRLREAWALQASGYALTREMLARQEAEDQKMLKSGRGIALSEAESLEREGLRLACWTHAIFAAWAFLSLDLPRSTLLDVTDSLALPAFKPENSLTFAYRNAHPRFDYSSIARHNAHSVFSQTTRILSLVITLSLPTLQVPAALHGAAPPPIGIGDERTSRMPAFAVGVASWLLGLADGWMTGPRMLALEQEQARDEGECPLLAACCAVLALSRLAPADGEDEDRIGQGLQVGGWRLVLRAVEMLVQAEASEGHLPGEGSGRRPRTGLQRVVGGALARSLVLLNRLLQLGSSASTSPALLSLVSVEQSRISLLQANLVALNHRPSSAPVGPPRHSTTSELVGPNFDFLLPTFPRSDSSSSDSLYTLATTNTGATSYKDLNLLPHPNLAPWANSPFPSLGPTLDSPPPLSTDGYSPASFLLSLPPGIPQAAPPMLHRLSTTSLAKEPLPLSLSMAAHTLPSPPETVVEERWTAAAAEPSLLSPVDMIRRILGKGKRGSAKRRKEMGRV